jgi:uncharacterized membrane protein
LSRDKKEKEKDISFSRNDEKWWILGMFYCNKNDPLIFVRGRGRGLAPNYGHIAIKISIAVGILAVATLLIVFRFIT